MQLLLPCSLESNVTVHATVDGMKGRKEGKEEEERKRGFHGGRESREFLGLIGKLQKTNRFGDISTLEGK